MRSNRDRGTPPRPVNATGSSESPQAPSPATPTANIYHAASRAHTPVGVDATGSTQERQGSIVEGGLSASLKGARQGSWSTAEGGMLLVPQEAEQEEWSVGRQHKRTPSDPSPRYEPEFGFSSEALREQHQQQEQEQQQQNQGVGQQEVSESHDEQQQQSQEGQFTPSTCR